MTTRTQPESGMSMIELTIAIGILGIVMAAVTTTMIVAMRATQEASDRLDRGNDLQLASAYFSPDVSSTNEVVANNQPGITSGAANPDCGPARARLVVQFRGLDPVDLLSSRPRTVSYVLSADGTELVRRSCSASSRVVTEEAVVASGLAPAPGPVVACRTDTGTPIDCGQASTQVVTLDLTLADGSTRSMTGSRRTR